MDYEVGKSACVCAHCNKQLQEEEEHFSSLCDAKTEYVRRDYCLQCWPEAQSSDDQRVSFWRTRVPKAEEEKKQFVDDDVIFNFFMRLENETEPSKRNFRYVLGLLLMRKKTLKFDDIRRDDGGEALVLTDRKTGEEYVVYDPHLTEKQIDGVTEQLSQILNMTL